MTSDERQSIEIAVMLLENALEDDRKRRWWELPNRLWVGRAEHALKTLRRTLGQSPASRPSE